MSVPRDDIKMTEVSGRTISKSKLRALLFSHHNKHGFRGVFWDNKPQLFRAQIGGRGNRKSLGRFKTAKEAAAEYDKAAIELYGEDAALNFPLHGERKTIFGGRCSHGLADIYVDHAGAKHCRICNKVSAARYKEAMKKAGYSRKKYGPWFAEVSSS